MRGANANANAGPSDRNADAGLRHGNACDGHTDATHRDGDACDGHTDAAHSHAHNSPSKQTY